MAPMDNDAVRFYLAERVGVMEAQVQAERILREAADERAAEAERMSRLLRHDLILAKAEVRALRSRHGVPSVAARREARAG